MPAMLRPNSKCTKIAYKILGKPDNMTDDKKSKREKWIEKRLTFEDSYRVR